MTDKEGGRRRSSSLHFAEHSILTILIPHASELDVEAALSADGESEHDPALPPLSSVKQRRLLYFGEHMNLSDALQIILSYSFVG